MNQIEQLETLLHAWQPRRPSAKCKTAIFGKPSGAHRATLQLLWNWSLPVAACFMLLLATLDQRGGDLSSVSRIGGQTPTIAMLMSNETIAAFWPGNAQSDQNTLRNTFEWTNASRCTPSIAPLIH